MFRSHLSHELNIFQRIMLASVCLFVCVWERKKVTLHTDGISSILIMRCVYLEASRRSAMWFVDVHSNKLPSPSSVFMEHLWHKDSTWGAERTHTHTHTHQNWQTIQSTGRNSNTHIHPLATSSENICGHERSWRHHTHRFIPTQNSEIVTKYSVWASGPDTRKKKTQTNIPAGTLKLTRPAGGVSKVIGFHPVRITHVKMLFDNLIPCLKTTNKNIKCYWPPHNPHSTE